MKKVLQLSTCTVDLVSGAVDSGARLSELERDLLAFLAARSGQPASRQLLLVEVFGYSSRSSSRTVDTTVRRLRAKIDPGSPPRHLQTVYGVGYRLVMGPPAVPVLGREAERAALDAMIAPGAVVSVVGLPGVGKSALLDGLSGVSTLDHIDDRLEEAAAEVARRPPGDAVVVACRQPLRVPGERVLLLHPLRGPAQGALRDALGLPPGLDGALAGLPGAMVRAASALRDGTAPAVLAQRGCRPELAAVWAALGATERSLLGLLATQRCSLSAAEAALGVPLLLAAESLMSRGMLWSDSGALVLSPPLRGLAGGR